MSSQNNEIMINGRGQWLTRIRHRMFVPVRCLAIVIISACTGNATETYPDLDTAFKAEDVSQNVRPGDESSFERFFKRESEISLSDDVLLGQVIDMDLDGSGQLVVVDQTGEQTNAHLFSDRGEFIRTLEVETCHPDFAWRPGAARFRSDGNLIVLMYGPSGGFLFDSQGSCLHKIGEQRFSPNNYTITSQDDIIHFDNSPVAGYNWLRTSPEGEHRDTIASASILYHVTGIIPMGGMAVDTKDQIYLSVLHSPYVFRLNLEGGGVGRLGYKPSYFRRITEEGIPEGVAPSWPGMLPAIMKNYQVASMTGDVYLLNDETIIVTYLNTWDENPSRAWGLHVMDSDGRSLVDEEIRTDASRPLIFAKDGFAYGIWTPEQDPDGEARNPSIVKYRFEAYPLN